MPNSVPTAQALAEAMQQVSDLTLAVEATNGAVEALTSAVTQQYQAQIRADRRQRRTQTWGAVLAFSFLASLGGLYFVDRQRQHQATCTALNVTNRQLVDLLEQARAASPRIAPDGLSAQERAEFRARLERSDQFFEDSRARLAPKKC
jgi:hypothetical protein